MDHIWSCIGLNHEKFSKSKNTCTSFSGICIVCQECVLYVRNLYCMSVSVIMPPTLEKLKGHIALGLSVRPTFRLFFRVSVQNLLRYNFEFHILIPYQKIRYIFF